MIQNILGNLSQVKKAAMMLFDGVPYYAVKKPQQKASAWGPLKFLRVLVWMLTIILH